MNPKQGNRPSQPRGTDEGGNPTESISHFDLNIIEQSMIENLVSNAIEEEEIRRYIFEQRSVNDTLRANIVKIQMELEKFGEEYTEELSRRNELLPKLITFVEGKHDIIQTAESVEIKYRDKKASSRRLQSQLAEYGDDENKTKSIVTGLVRNAADLFNALNALLQQIDSEDKEYAMSEEEKCKIVTEIEELKNRLLKEQDVEHLVRDRIATNAENEQIFAYSVELDKRLEYLQSAPKRSTEAVALEEAMKNETVEHDKALEKLRQDIETEQKVLEESHRQMEDMDKQYDAWVERYRATEGEICDNLSHISQIEQENEGLERESNDKAIGEFEKELEGLEAEEEVIMMEKIKMSANVDEEKAKFDETAEVLRVAKKENKIKTEDLERMKSEVAMMEQNTVRIEETKFNWEAKVVELEGVISHLQQQIHEADCYFQAELKTKEKELIGFEETEQDFEEMVPTLLNELESVLASKEEIVQTIERQNKALNEIEDTGHRHVDDFKSQVQQFEKGISALSAQISDKKAKLAEAQTILEKNTMGEPGGQEQDIAILRGRIEGETLLRGNLHEECEKLHATEGMYQQKFKDLEEDVAKFQQARNQHEQVTKKLMVLAQDLVDLEKAVADPKLMVEEKQKEDSRRVEELKFYMKELGKQLNELQQTKKQPQASFERGIPKGRKKTSAQELKSLFNTEVTKKLELSQPVKRCSLRKKQMFNCPAPDAVVDLLSDPSPNDSVDSDADWRP